MTKERFGELRIIRVALEGLAASRAATLVTSDDLQRIHAHHERLRRAAQRERPDPAIVIRANQRLHFEIYRSARGARRALVADIATAAAYMLSLRQLPKMDPTL